MQGSQDEVSTADVPSSEPESTQVVEVRAGLYATVDGRTYRARTAPGSPVVGLVVHGEDAAPPDFVWDDRMGGHWHRRVTRSECSRLFRVLTSAWWRVFPVLVHSIDGPWAHVDYAPDGYPAPGPRDGRGRFLEPPLPPEPGAGWRGSVPAVELSRHVEWVQELPLETVDRWPDPVFPELGDGPATAR